MRERGVVKGPNRNRGRKPSRKEGGNRSFQFGAIRLAVLIGSKTFASRNAGEWRKGNTQGIKEEGTEKIRRGKGREQRSFVPH